MSKKKSTRFRLIDAAVILFCIAGFFLSGAAFWNEYNRTMSKLNEEPIGTITYKKRTVQRKFLERLAWDRLRQESTVYNGDTIRTIEVSETAITFKDLKTRLVLGENTLIQIFYSEEHGVMVDFSGKSMAVDSGDSSLRVRVKNGSSRIIIEGEANLYRDEEGFSLSVISGSAVYDGEYLTQGDIFTFDAEGTRIEKLSDAPPSSAPELAVETPIAPIPEPVAEAAVVRPPPAVRPPRVVAPPPVAEPPIEVTPPPVEEPPVEETPPSVQPTARPIIDDAVVWQGNGHRYLVVNRQMNWDNADIYARNNGGYLATITSKEEQGFILELISKDGNVNYFWIGGYLERKSWRWVTGERFGYTNWAVDQPDNFRNAQERIAIMRVRQFWGGNPGQWDDEENSSQGFIIEWDAQEAE